MRRVLMDSRPEKSDRSSCPPRSRRQSKDFRARNDAVVGMMQLFVGGRTSLQLIALLPLPRHSGGKWEGDHLGGVRHGLVESETRIVGPACD